MKKPVPRKPKAPRKPALTPNDLVAHTICRVVYRGNCGCGHGNKPACDVMLSAARSTRAMIHMQETK